MHESPMVMIIPLIVLAIGAISSGYLFKELFIGQYSSAEFWGNSIKFLEPLSTESSTNVVFIVYTNIGN